MTFLDPGGGVVPPQDSQLQIGLVLNRLPLSYLSCASYQHGCIASCPSCPLIPFLCPILSFLLLSVASPILIVPPLSISPLPTSVLPTPCHSVPTVNKASIMKERVS